MTLADKRKVIEVLLCAGPPPMPSCSEAAAHACQHCGHVWRPAIVDTVGVQFLPGFKNGDGK